MIFLHLENYFVKHLFGPKKYYFVVYLKIFINLASKIKPFKTQQKLSSMKIKFLESMKLFGRYKTASIANTSETLKDHPDGDMFIGRWQ